jgi:catechol 2,3-dioxygenase-like lactoylglutathione lyase family enzyme
MLIDHVGILVDDLEQAIERWTAFTGYTFSAVGRYRTDRYEDSSSVHPHSHDARFVVSREGQPKIELLEATGTGTHGPANLGIHHLALIGFPDLEAERDRVTALGIGIDGVNTDAEGRILLAFTDPSALDGARFEIVSNRVAPIVHDDGTPAAIDPRTGRKSMWMPKPVSDVALSKEEA